MKKQPIYLVAVFKDSDEIFGFCELNKNEFFLDENDLVNWFMVNKNIYDSIKDFDLSITKLEVSDDCIYQSIR